MTEHSDKAGATRSARVTLGVIHLGIAISTLFVATFIAAQGAAVAGQITIFLAVLLAVGGVGWAMRRGSCLWILVGANAAICSFGIWLCAIVIGRMFERSPRHGNPNELGDLLLYVLAFVAVTVIAIPAVLTWALLLDGLSQRQGRRS